MTDLGNAERLTAIHGDKIRYNVDVRQWLVWTGTHWQPDNKGNIHLRAREVVRGLYDLLKDSETIEQKDQLFGHAKRSESQPKLEAMIKSAQYCEGISVEAADFDKDHMLFNSANGTLDLRTGELREHRQEDMITKTSPVVYDPNAKSPRWQLFLDEVFRGDKELIGFAKRLAGYCLSGDTREQAFIIMCGKGSNGKGVFVNTLCAILGDYAANTPVTTFLERRGESTSCDLAGLTGARMVDLTPRNWSSSYVRMERESDRRGQANAEEDIHDRGDHKQAQEGRDHGQPGRDGCSRV